MTVDTARAGGHMPEIGWGDSDDRGSVSRAGRSVLLLIVASVYWGLVWLLSGLAPFAYLTTHLPRGFADRKHLESRRG
jgi:hypothetical protein